MAVTSFTTRTTALLAVLVTGTTAVVLAVGGWLLHRQAMNGLDALNAAEFREVVERMEKMPAAPTAAEVESRVRPHAEIDAAMYFFQVSGAGGELLFRSPNLGRVVLPTPTEQPDNREETLPGIGRVRVSEFRLDGLRVQIAASSETAERMVRAYAQTSVALLGCVALASVGLGWSFARFVLRPLRAIRETASRIGADNLGERIPVPCGGDELTALTRLLNEMLGRLEASFVQVKRFTADASHELKTPLALIRLNAEKLRARVAGDPEASEAVGDLLEDIDRLRTMLERLLFLAKADSGALALPMTELATDEFVRSVAEDGRALAEDVGVRFAVTANDVGRGRGDATLLRQLAINLVSNACRAAEGQPAGEVTLASRLDGDRWRFEVADNGPGLPAEQLERIFERFVRYTPPGRAAQAEGGHGLGLAICRSIARLHGGTIRAENRTDRRGLRLIVELPIALNFSA